MHIINMSKAKFFFIPALHGILTKPKCILPMLALLLFSCNETPDKRFPSETKSKSVESQQMQIVQCTIPGFGNFSMELKTTGKAYASKKATLNFTLDEKITAIYVKNGQYVKKGHIIAQQDRQRYRNEIIKSQEQLARALIDVEDILLGFNYQLKDSATIPSSVLDMAKNRSNYHTSVTLLQNARRDWEATLLKSPINGVVANMNSRVYSYPNVDNPFCTIIDNTILDVEFRILEEDYLFLSPGQPIDVSLPLMDEILNGKITEINPLVDENGMITVKGRINNKNRMILDGMNVEVVIRKEIPNKLYIPKSGIVLRDGKKVVFTQKNGIAIWNYVQTSYENFTSVVIESGLKTTDSIIYSGNENLAHKAKITISDL